MPDGPEVDTPVAAAMLTIDPGSASFGSVTLGTTSQATAFTITNTGAQATGALGTALGGGDAASFAISENTCIGVLAPSASCTVAVVFAPLATCVRRASLTVMGMPGAA